MIDDSDGFRHLITPLHPSPPGHGASESGDGASLLSRLPCGGVRALPQQSHLSRLPDSDPRGQRHADGHHCGDEQGGY